MERRVKVAIEIDDEDRLKCGERCAYLETSHKVFGMKMLACAYSSQTN